MATWATASTTIPLHPSLDMDISAYDTTYDPASTLEARCPMCRTPTVAHPDPNLAQTLEQKYPVTYAERRAEDEAAMETRDPDGVEPMTILIGNHHKLVQGAAGSVNKHDWTFFVRVSKPDLISHVRVNLHPTFRPPTLILRALPFEVRRLGWGYFNIQAEVVLKEGWEWVGGTEVRGELSDRKGALGLGWMLEFEGEGRQGRIKAGVRKVERDVEGDGGSPVREPSPVVEGSPVRDVSPVRGED